MIQILNQFRSWILNLSILLIIWNFVIPNNIKKMTIACVQLIRMLIFVRLHNFKYNGKAFSYADIFEEYVDKYPNHIQFESADDNSKITLQEMDELANQFAWWLLHGDQSVRCLDKVAIMILNRVEYTSIWLGCSKIGATSALLNTNASGKTLIHALNVSFEESSSKILILDDELIAQVQEDFAEITRQGIKIVYLNRLKNEFLINFSKKRPPREIRSKIIEKDALILIFTSGTTGLPKASKISQSRFYVASIPFSTMASLSTNDRIYNTLPLYHSAGGMLGVGSIMRSRATMVLRKKFSASKFADDCVKFNCNVIQYIGELCRYLVNKPPSLNEDKLAIRLAFGNGMRPEVWPIFQKRFRVQRILEFYASTEGNLALFNSCDHEGALGFIPRFADILYPVSILRVDEHDKTIPYRDANGRCQVCKPNEVGLLVASINNKRIDRRFDGYTDSAATSKKILYDVFKSGDVYFNTGDLLYRDSVGYFFWSDRTGDTFRWKGENVSTTEVAQVLASIKGVSDACVYGVEILNCDGKAGMATITLSDSSNISNFDWNNLANELSLHLPTYARPLFIRVQKEIKVTSTFKHIKADLVKEGFNLSLVNDDPVFFHLIKEKKLVPLTKDIFDNIQNGKLLF